MKNDLMRLTKLYSRNTPILDTELTELLETIGTLFNHFQLEYITHTPFYPTLIGLKERAQLLGVRNLSTTLR